MDEGSEMRQDALAQGSLACQKYETEKDIAKHVRVFSKFLLPVLFLILSF